MILLGRREAQEAREVDESMSIPLFLTGVGVIAARLAAPRVLTAIAFLVGAFVVVGALSVGIYYVPSEAALIVAAAKERRQ
jgi:hypothetical protein